MFKEDILSNATTLNISAPHNLNYLERDKDLKKSSVCTIFQYFLHYWTICDKK